MVKVKHRYTDFDKDYIKVAQFRVKHRDVFHLKYLYMLMHEWLIEEHYVPSRKDEEFPETFFLNREQKRGREMWFSWRLHKFPVSNKFWRYDLDIDVHVLDLQDTEIIHNGQKYKANSGEVEVKVWAYVIADYTQEWKKHPLLKHLKKLFWKRIIYAKLERHKDDMYHEAYRFQEAIKTYLKLKTYLPEHELDMFWKTRELDLGGH